MFPISVFCCSLITALLWFPGQLTILIVWDEQSVKLIWAIAFCTGKYCIITVQYPFWFHSSTQICFVRLNSGYFSTVVKLVAHFSDASYSYECVIQVTYSNCSLDPRTLIFQCSERQFYLTPGYLSLGSTQNRARLYWMWHPLRQSQELVLKVGKFPIIIWRMAMETSCVHCGEDSSISPVKICVSRSAVQ